RGLRGDLGSVAEDVEELDLRLGVQQAADVLRHLRDVLDHEEANLVAACHRTRVYTSVVCRDRAATRAGSGGAGSSRAESGEAEAGPRATPRGPPAAVRSRPPRRPSSTGRLGS